MDVKVLRGLLERHHYALTAEVPAFRTRRVYPLRDLAWARAREKPPLGAVSYPLRAARSLPPRTRQLWNLFFRHQPRMRNDDLLTSAELDALMGNAIEPLGEGYQARVQVACARGLFLLSSIPGRTPGEYVYLGDDTGVLMHWAAGRRGGRALDLGTGCGAVALSLDFEEVVGSDVNPDALRFAGWNAELNQRRVTWVESDLWSGIQGKFELVISNPPALPLPVTPGLTFVAGGPALTLRLVEGLGDHLSAGGEAFILTFSQGRQLWDSLRLSGGLSLVYEVRERFWDVGVEHVQLTITNDGAGRRALVGPKWWRQWSLPWLPPGPAPQAMRPGASSGPPRR